MDEDRLSPELGRLIDAAKAAAAAPGEARAAAAREDGVPARSEGWAWLGANKQVYAGHDPAAALAAARMAGGADPLAAAFAVAGEQGDTLLPEDGWQPASTGLDPETPAVVKYLGRWVVVTLAELGPA
jgi:hypothetical protein